MNSSFIKDFHEKEYDGIVLKIPSWFIPMNDLEPILKKLHEELLVCNKSMLYSDHVRNLYELDNYKKKKDIVKEREAQRESEYQKTIDHYKGLINESFFELEWIKKEAHFYTNSGSMQFKVNGEVREFDEAEIVTKKGIRAEFEKLFRDNIKTYKNLIELNETLGIDLSVQLNLDLQGSKEEFFDLYNYTLFQSVHGSLGMSYKRLCVKLNWKKGKRGYSYNYYNLIEDSDGTLRAYNRNTIEASRKFEGFHKSNLKLLPNK